MTSPRLMRLAKDYETLRLRFDAHPFIDVQPLGPAPHERYRVLYRLPSLRLNANNMPTVVNQTVVDFELPATYPKDKPRAVATERVFHPNFGDWVCIADFWSPAQSLADIVLEVGEMLQWQKYNIQSPLSATAADWAVKNAHQLPVGDINLPSHTTTPEIRIISNQRGDHA